MPSRRSNRSELDDLSAAQRTAVSEGAQALDHLTGRASFNAWMQVARGIVPLCALADKPGRSRSARRSLFKEAGYGSLSAANISRLLHMGRLESQIVIWRMGLKPRQRETWNSPATICKRCPEVRKAIEEANKNRPPRQPRPRPGVNPADELERTINRVFDLLDALKDVDLRRQQIERLTTLLSELSEKEMAAEGSVEAVLAAFDALLVALKKKTALERHQIVNPLLEDLGDRLLEAHADDDNTLQEHWEREWDERRRKRAAAKRAANKAKREAAAKAQQEAEG